MSEESPEKPEARKRERADADHELVRLWQQHLREDLRHRKNLRAMFEEHEKVLGRKVRQLRLERGWTQEQLADKLNAAGWSMHQTTIAKLEAGTRPIRVAEADALAVAFSMPLEALWYLPITGEPWALAKMREHLKEKDQFIRLLEDQLHSMIVHYADEQWERMRIVEAINEGAKAAERGEMDLGLSLEDSRDYVEAMDDRRPVDRDEVRKLMSQEDAERDRLRYDLLDRIHRDEPSEVAAEAWRRYQAGGSPEDVGRFIAESMPRETLEPLRDALDIVRDALGEAGVSGPDAGKED